MKFKAGDLVEVNFWSSDIADKEVGLVLRVDQGSGDSLVTTPGCDVLVNGRSVWFMNFLLKRVETGEDENG